jgi:hypothetical protein
MSTATFSIVRSLLYPLPPLTFSPTIADGPQTSHPLRPRALCFSPPPARRARRLDRIDPLPEYAFFPFPRFFLLFSTLPRLTASSSPGSQAEPDKS